MKIGFIGIGNMGGAILKGYAKTGKEKGDQIFAFDPNQEKAKALTQEYQVYWCQRAEELLEKAEIIVIGVKPSVIGDILEKLKGSVSGDHTIVSMAAGITIGFMEEILGQDKKIVRIMPNTPAQVSQGMTAICGNRNVEERSLNEIKTIFEGVGRVAEIKEEAFHTVIGVSGSSPAYTYMYIEALANAAFEKGMDKNQAIEFAAQAVLGAAKMVLETKEDPKILRDNVCSPNGTTIEAVQSLEKGDFVEEIKKAFDAAYEKSKEMTK